MGLRPWVALVLVGVLGAAALAILLPLAARVPFLIPPSIWARFNPQHIYKAPGVNGLIPVLAGILVVTLCAVLYFTLTEPPQVVPYKPPGNRR